MVSYLYRGEGLFKRFVAWLMFTLLLASVFTLMHNVRQVKGVWTGTVYILADGSISPQGAPIITYDNMTYTLTDNIVSSTGGIVVGRDNIIIEGAGHTLQGMGAISSKGVYLSGRTNVTIKDLAIQNFDYGILLDYYSNNNSILDNDITANNGPGILLDYYSNNNSILDNDITANNGAGILLDDSSKNYVSGNNIANNYRGIGLDSSNNNFILSNNITANNNIPGNNGIGIYLSMSSNNYVLGNNITNNGIGVYPNYSFNNYVSGNNIANNTKGVYLYYYSNNNSILNNDIANNYWGVYLDYYSNNNSILDNDITASEYPGVYLYWSSNNYVSDNDIANNYWGVYLDSCSYNNSILNNNVVNNEKGMCLNSDNNSVSGNNIIANNESGIVLGQASNNYVLGNNITNNGIGVYLDYYSSNNKFYHNNFINNNMQVGGDYDVGYNIWSDGYPSGGNYWSNYTGVDFYSGPYQNKTGSDGIGDLPYIMDANNRDDYPLIGQFNALNADVLGGATFSVDVVSNSTISDFHFNPTEGPYLKFNVTGFDGTKGFCRVAIPKQLLWAKENEWKITVDGELVSYSVTLDENNSYLYFTYQHSTKIVAIEGTEGIPEFPQSTLLLLPTITLLTASILLREKRKNKP